MRTTPNKIISLGPNEIFAFGSNLAGRHGKGAAKDALRFGAIYGKGMGLHGQTWAIATKGRNLEILPLSFIEIQVRHFLDYATFDDQLTFLVTPIGCGLAGYKPSEIAPMFKNSPSNVVLPACFQPYL